MQKTVQELIIDHYENIWRNQAGSYLWDKGPINKLPFEFRVLEFSPTRSREMWTYATCGLSQIEDKDPLELHIFSSERDDSNIEILTAIAYYHRNTRRLGLNHIVNFGRAWRKQSLCDHGFISLPYLDGQELENLQIPSNKGLIQIKFYWLIPITENEAAYTSKYGVDALESKFEENSFNYLDYNRDSLV